MSVSASVFALLATFFSGAMTVRSSGSAALSASSFAGATTSAIFPILNATNAAPELDLFFPEASAVGFAGSTSSAYLPLCACRNKSDPYALYFHLP